MALGQELIGRDCAIPAMVLWHALEIRLPLQMRSMRA
jgi:hypothetical protein